MDMTVKVKVNGLKLPTISTKNGEGSEAMKTVCKTLANLVNDGKKGIEDFIENL